jgi:predicted nucleic acid-binding protein
MDQSTEPIVGVVNSTPLIALSIVGHLDLLPLLFDQVLIPTSVYREVVQQGRGRPGSLEIGEADWLTVTEPKEATPLPAELMGLDEGEIDVILLAREIKADWVLIDEKLARQIAKAVGLQVKGTLGILLVAYRTGLLSRADSLKAVSILAESSVRLSSKLVRWFEEQVEQTSSTG